MTSSRSIARWYDLRNRETKKGLEKLNVRPSFRFEITRFTTSPGYFSFQTLKIQNFSLLKKKGKRELKWNPRCRLPPSSPDSSTIICTDLRQFSTSSRTINLFHEDLYTKTRIIYWLEFWKILVIKYLIELLLLRVYNFINLGDKLFV